MFGMKNAFLWLSVCFFSWLAVLLLRNERAGLSNLERRRARASSKVNNARVYYIHTYVYT